QLFHFTPVPFPVDWVSVSRTLNLVAKELLPYISSSANCEHSPPKSRGDGPTVDPTVDETCGRPRGGLTDGPSRQHRGEISYGESWMERPISSTLLGHEIMEERTKFTVYKILVAGSQGDNWVIFRRYTDFCRLSDKLQELFPSFHPALPPKRWLKNSYDEEFLEGRKAGLQTFLENLVLHKEVLRRCVCVRFLCFVEAPSPFDSLEESRSLEETHLRLQSELADKQREADRLKKTLEERENCLNLLLKEGVTKSTTSKYQAHRSPIMCIYSILCCLMREKNPYLFFYFKVMYSIHIDDNVSLILNFSEHKLFLKHRKFEKTERSQGGTVTQ
uniref:PX domain-containing protein n=1 Tax=Haplochromis burtoni TaxID=8153 RepID=A0A3Q2VUS1_HAPBU